MSLEIERTAAIVWIRVQMARHGLALADLQAAGCFAVVAPSPPPPAPARTYRNAEGQKWGGQGEMPAWLQRAVNAGQSVEHFRVAGSAAVRASIARDPMHWISGRLRCGIRQTAD